MYQLSSYWTYFCQIWYWWLLLKPVKKIEICSKLGKNVRLQEDLSTFILLAAVQNYLQLDNNAQVTHCCMSIATVNSFTLLTATRCLIIQCIFMAMQYSLLLSWKCIVPQYKRSTLLYFHGNTFSICILLIMTCNNSTKKKALLFPWLQWLCKHATLHYMYILPHLPNVHFVRYFVTKLLYALHVWPSHSCAASIAASSSLLFSNIGKLHRDIFEEHYTSC